MFKILFSLFFVLVVLQSQANAFGTVRVDIQKDTGRLQSIIQDVISSKIATISRVLNSLVQVNINTADANTNTNNVVPIFQKTITVRKNTYVPPPPPPPSVQKITITKSVSVSPSSEFVPEPYPTENSVAPSSESSSSNSPAPPPPPPSSSSSSSKPVAASSSGVINKSIRISKGAYLPARASASVSKTVSSNTVEGSVRPARSYYVKRKYYTRA